MHLGMRHCYLMTYICICVLRDSAVPPALPQFQPQEVMAGAAEASGSRLRKGSGEILDAVDLAEELDFDDEAVDFPSIIIFRHENGRLAAFI
jgi:hypothetical protein